MPLVHQWGDGGVFCLSNKKKSIFLAEGVGARRIGWNCEGCNLLEKFAISMRSIENKRYWRARIKSGKFGRKKMLIDF